MNKRQQKKIKKEFLEFLIKTPVIQVACAKLGVARSTYYRWKEEDVNFANDAEMAELKGRELINDLAESKIINNIQNGDNTASIFWLKHNKPHIYGFASQVPPKPEAKISLSEEDIAEMDEFVRKNNLFQNSSIEKTETRLTES